ncbi:hypothetical protein [Flavobacterium sp. NRK1]|uniref:hypothetical protein n=1 Tax=Flavobacterium sp. NRK1 TaxID=2954929 RepID=UPI002092CF0A|nr:hypothetical protein [Flavobacterium sp. NRK1]MCO6146578.1 hypothetical protein [Flavobacterium sp. NRK1]
MKIIVNFVLFMFLSFLAVPTIVSLLQDDADMSMVYSLTEEEIQKEIKEVKAAPSYLELHFAFFAPAKKTTIINSANPGEHDNVSRDICSPPPELI